MKPNGKGRGGGILKGNATNGGPREAHSAGRGVRFSANSGEDNVDRRIQAAAPALRTPSINNTNNEYDSDDEEAIMASGEAFIHTTTNAGGDDDLDMKDASLRTPAEIEEAKRKRGRVRRHEDIADTGDFEKDDMDDDDDNNNNHNQHYNKTGGRNNEGLSLITNTSANPDAYESNAAGNASCPVEPFNMNSEKDGGLGYFDGDTYVFRQNTKPVDGEEDAWLDGIGSDDEKEIGSGGGGGKTKGGGLDSTSIWKPSDSKGGNSTSTTIQQKKKKKAKFVNEDAIPEDLGRRLVTLLSNDEDTVMIALAKHGATMRELSSQETKLMKKNKVKKRGKSSKSKDGGGGESATKAAAAAPENDVELKTIKRKVEQTRETVEELTELADALLFDGETEAYELTRRDWIHRFKLEQYFPSSSDLGPVKRPADGQELSEAQAKKRNRGYFDNDGADANTNKGDDDTQQQQAGTPTDKPQQQHGVDETVLWEYKGNEDGAIHGPYTSKQMLDWTSCGYFVGTNAVDIRRVQTSSAAKGVGDEGKQEQKSEEEDAKNTDVDDLMADLMDDDDDDEGESKKEDETTAASESATTEALWMRSDRVDFSLYM